MANQRSERNHDAAETRPLPTPIRAARHAETRHFVADLKILAKVINGR